MKKNYLLIGISLFVTVNIYATKFTITPNSNLIYVPATTSATVGDTVHIIASGNHPCVEVSQLTWNNFGNTPLSGGFGLHTSTFDFIPSLAGTIYFVCDAHAGSGMRGQINVTASGVSELSAIKEIRFVANPSNSGRLQIANTLDKAGIVYIYNMLGKLQTTKILNSDAAQIMDVNLPSGNYLCRFMMEGNWTRTEKLIISDRIN